MNKVFNLSKVKYRVGEGGLGSHSTGDILDAYKFTSSGDSDFELIFHPEENDDQCSSIDVCTYDWELQLYIPLNTIDIYVNL